MFDSRIRDLIEYLVNEMISTNIKERELGNRLRLLDDQQLTEVAYLIEDTINSHPDKPKRVDLDRVESYIGHHVHRADWQVSYDAMMDELDELNDFDHDMFRENDDGLVELPEFEVLSENHDADGAHYVLRAGGKTGQKGEKDGGE